MNAPVSTDTPGEPPLGDPWALPLDKIDVSDARIFQNDVWPDWFARLRRDDPVHFTEDSQFGPYWSVTKYRDIMKVETNPAVFSSASGITLLDQETQYRLAMFIAMDPPKHDVQRLVVAPIVAPGNLANMEGTIRERAIRILDGLPRNETFDWVEHVSVELTTQMLATLFDFPWEERRKLTRWSNIFTALPKSMVVESEEQRQAEMKECGTYFTRLWNEHHHAAVGDATRTLPTDPPIVHAALAVPTVAV